MKNNEKQKATEEVAQNKKSKNNLKQSQQMQRIQRTKLKINKMKKQQRYLRTAKVEEVAGNKNVASVIEAPITEKCAECRA